MKYRRDRQRFNKRDFYAIAVSVLSFLLALTLVRLFLLRGAEGVSSKAEGVRVPVVMYHSILKDSRRAGPYVITPEELEQDLIWLRDNGYETVSAAQLIDYVRDGGKLPEKPVLLTFDDGYYNNYLYAYPLLQKYGAKAVISVIGIHSEKFSGIDDNNAYYSHLTWEQLKEMAASGLVEIGSHSYNLHRDSGGRLGCSRKSGESEEAYRQLLTEDLGKCSALLMQNVGITPVIFAYPYGKISAAAPEIVRSLGFEVTFSCQTGVNLLRPGDELYALKRLLRPHGKGLSQMNNFG